MLFLRLKRRNIFMNRFLISIFIAILSFTFCFSQEGYSIKGKIKGWQDTVCYLGNYYGKLTPIMDTAKVNKDGSFVLEGSKKLPGGIYFIVNQKKAIFLEMLIDKEQTISFETDTGKTLERIKVKGSEETSRWYAYQNFIMQKQKNIAPFRKRISIIKEDSLAAATNKKDSLRIYGEKITAAEKEIERYREDFMAKHPDLLMTAIFKAQKEPVIPETPTLPNGRKDSLFPYRYTKDHFWDNFPVSDDRLLRTPLFNLRLKNFFDHVVVQHPDSINKEADRLVEMTKGNKETFKYIVWYLTTTYESSPIMGMDAVFVHQVEQYYVTNRAYWVDTVSLDKIIHRMKILRPLLLGKPAPPLILQDSADKSIALYDVRSKYTLLIFWDPDCGHCQKVLPKLKDAYDKTLKAKGLQVFSVDIEDNTEKWKKYLVENKHEWISVRDKHKRYYLRDLYDIYSTPVIYLLDENKKIKAKRIDVEQLSGYIDYLEKQKKAN